MRKTENKNLKMVKLGLRKYDSQEVVCKVKILWRGNGVFRVWVSSGSQSQHL